MALNKGDTILLDIDLDFNGQVVNKDLFTEIELVIGDLRFLLSTGGIFWNSTINKFQCQLEQRDTFELKPNTKYQFRVKTLDNQVKASEIETLKIDNTLSAEII